MQISRQRRIGTTILSLLRLVSSTNSYPEMGFLGVIFAPKLECVVLEDVRGRREGLREYLESTVPSSRLVCLSDLTVTPSDDEYDQILGQPSLAMDQKTADAPFSSSSPIQSGKTIYIRPLLKPSLTNRIIIRSSWERLALRSQLVLMLPALLKEMKGWFFPCIQSPGYPRYPRGA